MELLFNLLWFAASASLGAALLYSRSRRSVAARNCVHSRSAAWISYLILVAMLLPVISMTDDLQAMVTPSDGEQIVRRIEAALPGHSPVHLHPTALLHVQSGWLAPVFEAHPAEIVRGFRPSSCWHSQPHHGRAPPAVA